MWPISLIYIQTKCSIPNFGRESCVDVSGTPLHMRRLPRCNWSEYTYRKSFAPKRIGPLNKTLTCAMKGCWHRTY